MKIFVADSFTDRIFGGNQAGVVLLGEGESFPEEELMQKIAAELKHSETAFVKKAEANIYKIRYFTPEGEVELCGHATVAAFTVLRNEMALAAGDYIACTLVGNLKVTVKADLIWLQMAAGKVLKQFSPEESSRLYRAYGLELSDCPENMSPCIVNTGLTDILLPVKSKEKIESAAQNRNEVINISKEYKVVGVHMFCLTPDSLQTAICRNFAPLFGIDEEAATGTSNGALTYYLDLNKLIRNNEESVFLQGESMGKPSLIYSRIDSEGEIYIGGSAVISIEGCLKL